MSAGADAAQLAALSRLIERLAQVTDRRLLVDECVDGVVEILAADRGMIVVLDAEGQPFAVNARARGRSLVPREREEVSATVVKRALDEGRTVLWHDGGEWATESMSRFGILTAIAAPLSVRGARAVASAAGERLGVLYVDFRDPTRAVGEGEQRLITMAAPLVALLLEQARALALASERAREASLRGGGANELTLHDLLVGGAMGTLEVDLSAAVRGSGPVLIVGETGTGKTALAQALAEASGRTPVVRAMLGTSDELNTTVSELFGHQRGAFSGALAKRTGLVELADGGTLILDELLNLSLPAQKLLLDFTQFGTYRPLGYDRREPRQARVRLIACTNGDIEAAMKQGQLRSDLYYRLAGTVLTVPPLRQRRGAIGAMVRRFLAGAGGEARHEPTDALCERLEASDLPWPGNVRQLEHLLRRLIDRAAARGAGATIGLELLAPGDLGPGVPLTIDEAPAGSERAASSSRSTRPAGGEVAVADAWADLQRRRALLDEAEQRLVARALDEEQGVVARAARVLGTSRTSLLSRMQTLGVARPRTARSSDDDEG